MTLGTSARRRRPDPGRSPGRSPDELLPFIPAHALVEALAGRAHVPRDLERASGARVRSIAARLLPTDVIERLHEQWRYGRVGFTLGVFLQQNVEPSPEIDRLLNEALERLQVDPDGDKDERADLRVAGVDRFAGGSVIEIAFRYGRQFSYLDLDEREQRATESRYGFLWLDPAEQFVAATGDERVVELLFRALTSAFARPVHVGLDRSVMDAIFDIHDLYSISNLDLATGIRWRTSGDRLAEDELVLREVVSRDAATLRSDARYNQDLPDGTRVRTSLNAVSGRLVLSRQLPASVMRAWALPKLREIARLLHQLRKDRPMRFYQLSESLALDGVPASNAPVVRQLVPALAECRMKDRQQVPIELSAASLARLLPTKAGQLTVRAECTECGELVRALCARCMADTVKVEHGATVCALDPTHHGFSCGHDHALNREQIEQGLTYEPGAALVEWMSRGVTELDLASIDPTSEAFFVRDRTLHYQRRAHLPEGRYSLVVVDIAGSTRLRRRDEASYQRIRSAVRRAVLVHATHGQGRLGADRGDGAAAFFPTPALATGAARAIRDDIAKSEHNTNSRTVRVAIVTGKVLASADGYDGLLVHRAERLQQYADKGSRVVVDVATLMGLPPAERGRARQIGTMASVKGFEGDRSPFFLLVDEAPGSLGSNGESPMSCREPSPALPGRG